MKEHAQRKGMIRNGATRGDGGGGRGEGVGGEGGRGGERRREMQKIKEEEAGERMTREGTCSKKGND